MGRFAKPALVAGMAVLAALGAAEVALRLADVKLTGSFYRADLELGWSLRPGAEAWETHEGVAWTRINSHGYRDRERTLEKPTGVFRIAIVGDSITEARQVEPGETYAALLERRLNVSCPAYADRRIEVLNFGVAGYGTAQELLMLDRVWPFEPDLIVLQFFARNDVFNNVPLLNTSSPSVPPYFKLDGDSLVLDDSFLEQPELQPSRMFFKSALNAGIDRSRVLLLLYQLRLLRQRQRSLERPAERSRNAPGIPPNYHRFWFYLPPEHPAMAEAWAITEALVAELVATVRDHGAGVLVVAVPASEQVSPDEAVRNRFRRERGVGDFDYADRRIARIAAAAGATPLVLGPRMREYAIAKQVYLNGFENTTLGEGHFNAEGHRLMAKLIGDALCNRPDTPEAAVQ